jgi:predicted metal-binding membrane protein
MQTLRFPTAFLLGCATVFVIAAAATVDFCRSMAGGMDMPGGWTMSMMWMPMPGYTWTGSGAMFLLMWLVMMVAMMLPSALPMLLTIRKSTGHFEMLAVFAAAGFFFVWMVIGAVVYAAGVWYAIETMHTDWLSWITPLLSGGTLILCGIIQFTPWKLSKLRQCRAPDCGMLEDGRVLGGWRYGLKQGIACCLCCAGPMLALLVLGAMNLTAMVVIAGVIAAEKLLPWPEKLVRVFGVVTLLAGLIVIVKSSFFQNLSL